MAAAADGTGVGQRCARRVMLVTRRAPHGSGHAREALEAVLGAAGYELVVTLAFIDDGVWQLRTGQETGAAGLKDFSPTFRALPDFGVGDVYAEQESLALRGIDADGLLLPVRSVPASALREIMARQHMLLTF